MPGNILTTASSIMCPHGGQATLTTANSKTAAGAMALLETDVHSVTGCPFTLPGPKPSPCIRIEWSAGATNATVNGTPVLVQSSVGLCYSPESAPQGTAIIVNTQMKASAR
jgi:hypothetical protein